MTRRYPASAAVLAGARLENVRWAAAGVLPLIIGGHLLFRGLQNFEFIGPWPFVVGLPICLLALPFWRRAWQGNRELRARLAGYVEVGEEALVWEDRPGEVLRIPWSEVTALKDSPAEIELNCNVVIPCHYENFSDLRQAVRARVPGL